MKKYQLIIFETNRNDGCMSLAKNEYAMFKFTA